LKSRFIIDAGPILTSAEVVRHFLRLEATRTEFADRKDELLAWCGLPDAEVICKARQFAEERDDVNPVLVYTVGVRDDSRYLRVASWTRERVRCRDIYTCGISPCMRDDINAVGGNLLAFALQSSGKYPEFRPLGELSDVSRILIVVHHSRDDRHGEYEIIDGAHRAVAFCRARIDDVDAYVAHMRLAKA
jgi:ParB/Sulfiredoxin domain